MTNRILNCYLCGYPVPEFETRCSSCGSTNWIVKPKGKDNIVEIDKTKERILNGSPIFYELLKEAASMHDRKSHDYASNSDPLANYRFAGELSKLFRDPTDAGLIGRFGEKLYRLSNLETKVPRNESIEDTELDIIVIIGLFVASRRERRMKEIKDASITR